MLCLKVLSFIGFNPYLKSFKALDKYASWLKVQMTDIVTNSNNMFMEDDISKVTGKVPSRGVAV